MKNEEDLVYSREILFEKYIGVDFSRFDSPAKFSDISSEAKRWLINNWDLIYSKLKRCYNSDTGINNLKLCKFLGVILQQFNGSSTFKILVGGSDNDIFLISTGKNSYFVYDSIFHEFEFIFLKETEKFCHYHFVEGLNMLWATEAVDEKLKLSS